MKPTIFLAAALLAVGCTVDTSQLDSLDGYRTWHSLVRTDDVPGHGHTYRIIYVNDVARAYPHGGHYPLHSVMVKDVYDLRDDGTPGDLRYSAIMRRIGEEPYAKPPSGIPNDDGWLFTFVGSVGGDEISTGTCWASCHRAAPYDGAWLDYGE